MIDYKLIGRRIAFFRKQAGITQSVLSEKLGVTESYISQVERGSAKASLGRLSQIADALSIDIAQLVSDRAVAASPCISSEIAQILSGWSPEQVALLTELLMCADQRIRP